MTKAEAYDKAWRLGARGDFSLVDQIYHPDYSSFDYRTGIEANIEDDKVIASTLGESVIFGPHRTLFENENFLCIERFSKRFTNTTDPDYGVAIVAVNYEDGKIICQKTATHRTDFDPSEYLDWNWEDYE